MSFEPEPTFDLLLDGHADTPQRFLDEGWHFTDPLGSGMLNLETAREGGLDAQLFAAWVDPQEYPVQPFARALELIDAVHREAQRDTAQLAFCRTATDIVAAKQTGRFAMLLSVEGGHSIEGKLENLREFARRGVCSMTLTWSHSVGWADSSGDATEPTVAHVHGLSDFGREVVAEMNRLGMLVDVSHASDETFWAVLDASEMPVVASHSSARSLTAAPRNLSDDQLRALAQNGGLAMVNFFPAFIDEDWRTAWNGQKAERDHAQAVAGAPYRDRGEPVPFAVSNRVDREFAQRLPPAPLERLVDHFEHLLRVAGPDHVGIGSDFDGIPMAPQGMETAACLPRIVEVLEGRGWRREALQGLRGGNFLRVMRAAETFAAGRGSKQGKV